MPPVPAAMSCPSSRMHSDLPVIVPPGQWSLTHKTIDQRLLCPPFRSCGSGRIANLFLSTCKTTSFITMSPKANDQMDRSFLTASVPGLLKKLTTEEKVSLFAGRDWWK
jgi:hypothetical protein